MKTYSAFIVLVFTIVLLETSCKKDSLSTTQNSGRTIKFLLYTEKDFSNYNKNITFSLFIRNSTKTLFDSTLSPMKVKDIPNFTSKLIIEKNIPNDGSDLGVGFIYTIENVGISWHVDTCKAGQTFKIVDFSFQ